MPPQGQEFRSGILVKKVRRLAIRAAKFEPEADCVTRTVSLQAIVETVQKFSDGEQTDDITLVLARCRS
jgi:hypothetical protein